MGTKVINMDFEKAFEVNRTFCEKDLIFLGLLIVQNKLKEATAPTLRTLSNNAHIRVIMATGDNIMTAICVGRKSNLIEPNATVYSCEIETEENLNNSQNQIQDPLKRRASIGAYENFLNIQKEKEQKRKRLVWKTIDSFNDEDEASDNTGESNRFSNRISFDNRLSVLLPQEMTDDDLKIEDEKGTIIKVVKEVKDLTEDEEDENLEIDLDLVPFKEDQEGDIEIAVTGKTFETLYRLNQKYEKNYKNLQSEIEKLNEKNNNLNNSMEEYIINDSVQNGNENKVNNFKSFHQAFRLVLKYCSIYARCSPENKAQIVQSLQKEEFTVLMCGDGANDCSALKVADVGISLSTEEASIAAPFTSRTPDISCVIYVLKEGKCALVTSLQTFKYIILYSLIQFISVTYLMLVDSYLSNWEFMASDLFLITPLAFLIPLAPAYHKLTYHKPVSSLFSFSIIFSMTLQTLFVAGFQILAEELTSKFFPKDIFGHYRECVGEFDHFKPFPEGGIFEDDIMEEEEDAGVEEDGTGTEEGKEAFNAEGGNSEADNEEEEEDYYQECIDNSSIFYISFAQYLILAVAFCSGKPFKKNIFYNYGMLIFSIIGFIYSEYIVFYVDYFSRNFIYISAYPDDPFVNYYLLNNKQKNHHSEVFKYYIMVIIVINFIVSLFIEKVIVPKFNKCWKRFKMNKIKRRLESDLQKEADLNLINNVKNYIRQQKAKKKSD